MQKHILIIDDCEDVRFLLSLKLNNLGFKVSEAKDASDAIRFLNDFTPAQIDLILLDVMLLELTDNKLLHQIKKKIDGSKCKLACITTKYDEETATNYKTLGANDVLKKPIKSTELEKRIRTLLCG